MNKTIEQTTTTDNAAVSRLAYQLWENAGRPAGRDLEFWLAAESKVRAPGRQVAATTPAIEPAGKPLKSARASTVSLKKSWPKPYPNLPKF